ncbi:hypothetical protein BASA81_001357 [Batrachochytrium salamandrivorans]|nr:hypothetical protein BASA81_001357 [Batrachochytrium salamandrivorans]
MLLYDLLQVSVTATPAEIRKAYLILAKKLHPDKTGAAGSAEGFLQLKKAYDILSNEQSRKRYDVSGSVEDAEESESFQQAYERFRGVKITEQDIQDFQQGYRHTEEEEADLDRFFESHKGDVRMVLAYIVGSREEDVERFVQHWELGLKAKRLSAKFKREFNAAKLEIVRDLDGEESDEDDGEEESGEDEDDGFVVHGESEEEGEEEEHMAFSPGDDVQVKQQNNQWVDAFVLSARRNLYDLQLSSPPKNKLFQVQASLMRPKPAAKPRSSSGDVDASLAAMIQARGQQRQTSFLSQLETKYKKKQRH